MKAQLKSRRHGWKGQDLAGYMISKFAFIAAPPNPGDDIGFDFHCTIFDEIEEKGKIYLIPDSSFCIQIKSNHDQLDYTSKIEFLRKLDVPFYVGVINQKEKILEIYTAKYFHLISSLTGIPSKLILSLHDSVTKENCYDKNGNDILLRLPKIERIKMAGTSEDIINTKNVLKEDMRRIRKNISSTHLDSYILDFGNGDVRIIGGTNIIDKVRENLINGLIQMFFNLKSNYGIIENDEIKSKIKMEFFLYENVYGLIKDKYGNIPPLETAYLVARDTILK